jgi:hypothetical protein
MPTPACRIVMPNQLYGITPVGITADTGYALSSLTDDVPARAFRSSTAATGFTILVNRGVTTNFNWIGGFDFGGATSGRSVISAIQLNSGPDGVAWTTSLGTVVDINDRGDWGKYLPNQSDQWLRFIIILSASEKLDIGLLVCGVALDLPKTFTNRQQSRDRGIVVNNSEGGATFTGKPRAYREVVNLDWSVLTQEQHDAFVKLEEDANGQYSPFVLQPSTREPLVLFHGRLEEVQTWGQDPSTFYVGHGFKFRESGRAL